ncbi:MAG TPA: methionine synthase [Thermoanaerobaculia bacterium]|nr:methionine synthase [Thermoanaerobaculia bacterium]
MSADVRPDGASQRERAEALKELLAERVLVLDGATGTWLQGQNLTAADFGGGDLEGCNENLVFTRPDVVRRMHEEYFAAGADMVETNTFGGTPLVLAEYGLADRAIEQNRRAAELAREAAAKFATASRPRFVLGSMGPTTRAITVTGGATFDEMIVHYRTQAMGLLTGGADALVLETVQDTRNLKAGLIGVEQAFGEVGWRVPLMVSVTIEPTGTMLAGQSVDAVYAAIGHAPLLSVGLNCSTGPEFMTDHIRTLSGLARTLVSCYPNAGLPDADGRYGETPEKIASVLGRFVNEGWLNIVGGCCGTTPPHIAALAEAVAGKRPRRVPIHNRVFVSGIEALEIDEDIRPVLVGERTNVLGSRKFKRLIAEGQVEAAAEIARAQVKSGAQVIDICLQDPDRDEAADANAFLERVTKMVKVPLMLDSTDAKVMEIGLKWSQGKSILNSVNLEDGEARFQSVVPLARKYGAALVVGTIDEDPETGMGVTRERKLEIARRSYTLLTEKYEIPPEDIIFDPLVFPCGTGDIKYVGSAVETIEGIKLIKEEFPQSRTVLGVSNVSFGLPEAGREVLNSVFLYHATKAGLDLAIVNSEKIVRYPSIPEEERLLAENLIWNRGEDPVAAFAGYFKAKGAAPKKPAERAGTPLERLPRYILEGSKEGLVEDLEAVRADGMSPLDIINGPLMDGMREVGRLFNANELIVAEVLQSAEAMKAAVSHLQQFMEKATDSRKGKVILATVKGDVHDIGKNLVEIILGNNGYEIVNLGIKVPPGRLIEAYREHGPDLIGLSGLLVKSAQQMVTTAEDLTTAGVTVPMLVGGAALSQKFTDHRIAPAYGGLVAYARDAMSGLALADRIMSGETERAALAAASQNRRQAAAGPAAEVGENPLAAPAVRSENVEAAPPLAAPDREERVFSKLDLAEVWRYLNPHMLFAKHLGLRGSYWKLQSAKDPKLAELEALIERVKAKGWIRARAMYRYFDAWSEGNTIHLAESGRPVASFTFPRQAMGERLCLADFVSPAGGGARDSLALLITTAGEGVRAKAEELKNAGEYLLCHAVQALAVETAEAAAEWLHGKIREAWGFPDPPGLTMIDRFQARYQGKRYSFGYPACPELADQATLFRLLDGGKIGVELTEGFMMDPEASVSAMVLHHPQARYFAV